MRHHECHAPIIYPEGLNGEKICAKCGLVLDDTQIARSFTQWTPEWHSNWNEQDSETLKEWLTILRSVSCQLNIPSFPYREEAARTIRSKNRFIFNSQKLSKNKRATIAALMHLILEKYEKTRSIKQISKDLGLDSKSVMKQAWVLKKTLNHETNHSKTQRKNAIDYLHQYSGRITQKHEIIFTAEKTLIKIKRSGGNPIGLAAGALYNACKITKEPLSKERIGEIFHISPRTVYTNEAKIRKIIKKQTKFSTVIEVLLATPTALSLLFGVALFFQGI